MDCFIQDVYYRTYPKAFIAKSQEHPCQNANEKFISKRLQQILSKNVD